MKVNSEKRGFLRSGKPFFWLGDTAWLLFSRLNGNEIDRYLRNRAEKGFTVIQATLVHGIDYADPTGEKALILNDFSHPDTGSRYWDHVEKTIRLAGSLGIVMALLPAWGSFAKNGTLNTDNAKSYTRFLADRFGQYENVLWLLGGDVRGSDAPETFSVLGRNLKTLCPDQLIGFHPFGRCSSSQWFTGADWLDFHMFQSGHRDRSQRRLHAWDDAVPEEEWMGEENYLYVFRDLQRDTKPTLDGEPSYEGIPHGLHDPSCPYWTDREVRRYAWWSLLAGAAGFTYGHNAVMQFWDGSTHGAYGVRETWDRALDAPGAFQMGHLRRFMESIRWQEGHNAQDVLLDDSGKEDERNLAFLTPVSLCVYSYTGHPFALSHSHRFSRSRGYWYDPETGRSLQDLSSRDDLISPPMEGRDWLYVLPVG